MQYAYLYSQSLQETIPSSFLSVCFLSVSLKLWQSEFCLLRGPRNLIGYTQLPENLKPIKEERLTF